jgi:hypothetical protein
VNKVFEGEACKGEWREFQGLTIMGNNTTLFGTEWDPTNLDNVMEYKDGLFVLRKTKVQLEAGTLEYKVTDGSEDISYGWTWENNAKLTIDEAGLYNVTFTYEPNIGILVAKLGEPVTISVTLNDPEAGRVEGAGVYDKGESVGLQAFANEGYVFVDWMLDGEVYDPYEGIYLNSVTEDMDFVANFAKETYYIGVIWNYEYGEVTGEGDYEYGDTVTLIAKPYEGYEFEGWSNGWNIVSTDLTYQFVANDHRDLEALFAPKICKITLLAEGNGTVGFISGVNDENEADYGTMVDVSATPDDHNVFVGWTANGEYVSGDANYSFYATEDITLTAHFEAEKYTVEVLAENGKVTGAGEYGYGETARLEAIPDEGYHFVEWLNGTTTVSTEEVYKFSVEEDVYLEAVFEINKYSIQVEVYEEGTGEAFGEGMDVEHGTEVTVTARPADGYYFAYWKNFAKDEVVSEEANYTFLATEDITLTALFFPNTYKVAVEAEHGTVEGAGEYEHGEEVTLTATADEGYEFVRWEVDGLEVSTDPTYTFDIYAADVHVVAVFQAKVFEVSISARSEDGSATIDGMTYGEYEYGTTVTVLAIPIEGRKFVNWTVEGEVVSTEAEYTFIVTKSIMLEANFEMKKYVVNAVASKGATAILRAEADQDSRFVGWKVDGVDYSTLEMISLEVTNDLNVLAQFASTVVTVTVAANDDAMGTVSGGGDFNEGDDVTVVAEAKEGYVFVKWVDEAGATVSENAEYNFKVTAHVALTAVFELLETAVDNVAMKTPTTKVMKRGVVYILRNEKEYTVDGRLVK